VCSATPSSWGLIRPSLLGLTGHLDTLAHADIPELGGLWISLVNMLVRSLLGRDTNGTDTTAARRLQVQRHIRANLADPRLSPSRIADALHVSRRTLYAALAPDDDGVAAEIRRQRLDRARAMLLDPAQTRSVAQIAATVGLPNPAHFTRIFRARYGINPSELRGSPPQPRDRVPLVPGELQQHAISSHDAAKEPNQPSRDVPST
jgi:AraC-like DNA-binding protein